MLLDAPIYGFDLSTSKECVVEDPFPPENQLCLSDGEVATPLFTQPRVILPAVPLPTFLNDFMA